MSLIIGDDFQHILRVLNTNVDGRTKVMYALTQIKGIGRRLRQRGVQEGGDRHGQARGRAFRGRARALKVIVANPRQFRIPDWFLNRQKDFKDGKYLQLSSNVFDTKLAHLLDLECQKIRNHRGLRHYGVFACAVSTRRPPAAAAGNRYAALVAVVGAVARRAAGRGTRRLSVGRSFGFSATWDDPRLVTRIRL